MPRSKVIYSDEFPYHITARSNNSDWFDVPLNYCYGIYINVLEESKKRFCVAPHAFVLMNNHFHMMLSTPESNIGEFLRYFMTETSRGIGAKSSRINHIYGGRNHKSLITSSEYYAHCLKYVYRNPVKAGICLEVEKYKWSTISEAPSKMKNLMHAPENGLDEYRPRDHGELLRWLNEPTREEVYQQCRKAARRGFFEFKPCRKGQRKVDPKIGLIRS